MLLQKPAHLIVASLLLVTAFAISVAAQTTAKEQATELRNTLEALKAQEADLQTRLQELDEAVKPENIEKSLAGVGSTKPEELRAQRRQQLERERLGVKNQLDQLAISRARMEKSLATLDARAYQESARGPETATEPQVSATQATSATSNSTRPRKVNRKRKPVRKVVNTNQ
jgi:hypothetical protein